MPKHQKTRSTTHNFAVIIRLEVSYYYANMAIPVDQLIKEKNSGLLTDNTPAERTRQADCSYCHTG